MPSENWVTLYVFPTNWNRIAVLSNKSDLCVAKLNSSYEYTVEP